MPRANHVNPYRRYQRKPGDYSNGITVPAGWAAWVRTLRNQFVRILARPNTEDQTPVVLWYISYGATKGLAIRLTDMTEKEITALQVFLNDTIDLALPIIRLRDGRANDLVSSGLDDLDGRVDRIFPEVVNRAWARGIDSESILQRLAYIPGGDGVDLGSDPEPGDDEPGLAEYNSGDNGASDHVTPIVLD